MIRAGAVHAISTTGANLEEDVFNLVAYGEYEVIPHWRGAVGGDGARPLPPGFNRVTDTAIPEGVMKELERRLIERWSAACAAGERKRPSRVPLRRPARRRAGAQLPGAAGAPWMLAAMEAGVPVFSPGWEDSTTGNMFAAAVMRGDVAHHQCVTSGTEQFQALMEWYLANHGVDAGRPSVGFFQIGGGIAGDFAICAVPSLIQDMGREDDAVLGLLRADLRRPHLLRRLLRGGAQREDHLGQARRGDPEVRHRVRRLDRRAADLRLRPRRLSAGPARPRREWPTPAAR